VPPTRGSAGQSRPVSARTPSAVHGDSSTLASPIVVSRTPRPVAPSGGHWTSSRLGRPSVPGALRPAATRPVASRRLPSRANTVSHLGVAPPAGRYWTLHCVRAGAASETSALGLSLPKIRAFGGWGLRSLVPERRYINPMCPASQSGHRFFGWMTASAALESSSH
jgi:hypothetical protein